MQPPPVELLRQALRQFVVLLMFPDQIEGSLARQRIGPSRLESRDGRGYLVRTIDDMSRDDRLEVKDVAAVLVEADDGEHAPETGDSTAGQRHDLNGDLGALRGSSSDEGTGPPGSPKGSLLNRFINGSIIPPSVHLYTRLPDYLPTVNG